MKSNDKVINDVNHHFREALALKSSAIKPNAELDLFQKAANEFRTAYKLLETFIGKETDNSEKIKSQVLYHYYRHEENDCLYAFYLKSDDLTVAQEKIDIALQEIYEALNIIQQNLKKVNQPTQDFLIKMKTDWFYRKLVTEAKSFEPEAKSKSRNSDYVDALDVYKTMLDKYSQAKEYCLTENLPQQFRRISLGNYFALNVNVSQMLAGHMNTLSKQGHNLNIDIFKHFLESYHSSKKAFEANPEWTEYLEGQKVIKSNIQKFIQPKSENWPQLKKILTDNELLDEFDIKPSDTITDKPPKKEWSERKKFVMGIISALTIALIIYVAGILNKHKYYGEIEIKDEYYLLIATYQSIDSANVKYAKLKRLSKLSLEINALPDTLFLKSSNVDIGFGQDQIVIARHNTEKDKFIIALDLLQGQTEPDYLKSEAEILKRKIEYRLINIENELAYYETLPDKELKELKELSEELYLDLNTLKIEYYSNTDYRLTYGEEIK